VKFNFLHRQAHAGIDLTEDGREQWRAGYYFSGGASELSTNMRPYNVTLDKRGPKARAERRRCEVFLEGSGGMPPWKIFKFRVSEMPFPGLWAKI
jgi:hypothetical protein